MDWEGLALVGLIARPHGLKGQVIVNVETDFPEERFAPGSELLLGRAGGIETVKVASVRFHRGRPVIAFEGIESIDEAETLAGAELRVPVDRLAPLPDHVFYRHELVGCRVEKTDGTFVGLVTDVEIGLGGNRLVIGGAHGSMLVPLAHEICPVIDPAGRRIVIEPPEGLLELNAGL